MVWLKAKQGVFSEQWEHSFAWLDRHGLADPNRSRSRTEFVIAQVDEAI
jgi:hypothetical protein